MEKNDISALVARLGHIAKAKGITLAAAESCTGGMLCAAIVSDPRASGALERGFVVYSVNAKCELLGLERERVEQCGGVSEDIARALAASSLARSQAHLSIAITGFAGPPEGEEEVGLVHIAAARGKAISHKELHLGDIGRNAVCEQSVIAALSLAIELAEAHENEE